MSNYNPDVEVTFDRENFESHIDVDKDVLLTDNQWEMISEVLETRLWKAFEEIIGKTVSEYKDGLYDNPPTPTIPERISI